MPRTAQAKASEPTIGPPPPAERLSSAGLKPSRNRVIVLEELARESNDATAQELHQRLVARGRPIGLATVYRALATMSDAGVVDALPHGSNETCYRLCGKGHHHHLVCDGCHRVIELPGCPARGWIEKGAAEAGFEVTGHRLEARGLCADCRTAEPRKVLADGSLDGS